MCSQERQSEMEDRHTNNGIVMPMRSVTLEEGIGREEKKMSCVWLWDYSEKPFQCLEFELTFE